jgi:predicted DNA-binding transcriptional regulator AlpA
MAEHVFSELRVAEALDTITREMRTCPPEKVPDVLGGLARAQAIALARLLPQTPAFVGRPESEKQGDDRLLTVAEAAQMMAVSKHWLYQNGQGLPFALRIGSGRMRFSKNGLERWVKRRTSG